MEKIPQRHQGIKLKEELDILTAVLICIGDPLHRDCSQQPHQEKAEPMNFVRESTKRLMGKKIDTSSSSDKPHFPTCSGAGVTHQNQDNDVWAEKTTHQTFSWTQTQNIFTKFYQVELNGTWKVTIASWFCRGSPRHTLLGFCMENNDCKSPC